MRHWEPIFIEHSKIPVWLSKFAPIEIGAITLGFVVISRDEMSEITKRHETIHFQQFLETLFIGFVVFYLFNYFYNRYALAMSGEEAYFNLQAEKEAYRHDEDKNYLSIRRRYRWILE